MHPHWWAEPEARGGAFTLSGFAVLRKNLSGLNVLHSKK